ncbi:hypothetical protein LCGC14_1452780 [marine sediment metagenome]|uniref:Uncharacterized protein n=2 Tax=root TaxID=1 RepID=A0A831QMK7_9FLAO|nr:hypothetical protein [Methylophaga sp.]HEA19662.1 hypothetical protein [Pricia antarctica]
MATGTGILSKAALRPNKPDLNVDLVATTNGAKVNTYPTTIALATTNAQRMGPYDLLPLLTEGINENYEYDDDKTIQGKSGVKGHDVVSKFSGGPLELQGHYLGLDNAFALALGYEKPGFDDSPTYDESVSGDNPMTGTTTGGSTGTTLEDTNAGGQFVVGNIGEWVRISDSGDATEGQVRRITARASATTATIDSAWISDPGAGSDYEISRVFSHTFECSTSLHIETFDNVFSNYSTETSGNSSDVMMRHGTLVFEKTVDQWEWRGVMINQLTFNYSIINGLNLTADMVPFDMLLGSSVNTASTSWDYSAGPTAPIHLQERIIGADLTFRIDDFSTGTLLSSTDNQGISEWTMNINNNLKTDQQTTISATHIDEPFRSGFREITGTVTLPRYAANTFFTKYQADTVLMASLIFEGSTLTGTNISSKNTLKIWIRSLKLTNVSASIDGPGAIPITFGYKALIPTANTAVDTNHNAPTPNNANTEIILRSINNNPFNSLRAQNGE